LIDTLTREVFDRRPPKGAAGADGLGAGADVARRSVIMRNDLGPSSEVMARCCNGGHSDRGAELARPPQTKQVPSARQRCAVFRDHLTVIMIDALRPRPWKGAP